MTPDMLTSFNAVFYEAKQRGLTLNSFNQGRRETTFFANWRRGDEYFDVAQHERPFDALRDALLKAIGAGLPARFRLPDINDPAVREVIKTVSIDTPSVNFDDAF